jgi:hypothetical protein
MPNEVFYTSAVATVEVWIVVCSNLMRFRSVFGTRNGEKMGRRKDYVLRALVFGSL